MLLKLGLGLNLGGLILLEKLVDEGLCSLVAIPCRCTLLGEAVTFALLVHNDSLVEGLRQR